MCKQCTETIDQYTEPLQQRFTDPMPRVTMFADKYERGGGEAVGVAGLDDALLTEWPSDAHFTQYVAPSQPVRLRKDLELPVHKKERNSSDDA